MCFVEGSGGVLTSHFVHTLLRPVYLRGTGMCDPSRYTQRKSGNNRMPLMWYKHPKGTDVHKKGVDIWGTEPRRVGKDILLVGRSWAGRRSYVL